MGKRNLACETDNFLFQKIFRKSCPNMYIINYIEDRKNKNIRKKFC